LGPFLGAVGTAPVHGYELTRQSHWLIRPRRGSESRLHFSFRALTSASLDDLFRIPPGFRLQAPIRRLGDPAKTAAGGLEAMEREPETLLPARPLTHLSQADSLGITPYRWRTSPKSADYTQRAQPSAKYALFVLWLSLKDRGQSVPVISV
jgi:hypothetical protein